MRVLVIGGTGFIGAHIVRQLAAAGHAVAVYHRDRTPATLPDGVQQIVNPVSAFPIRAFSALVFEFEPEVVIHTFAMCEADAKACVDSFSTGIKRLVVLSSGDVYQAYGRLIGIEGGPAQSGLLAETAPLREVLFPYRQRASSPESLEYSYEKILVERTVLGSAAVPATVLRLPKVYGPGSNADLATVYRYRHHPGWRWTHGYVENIAAATVLAATKSPEGHRIYNLGEEHTPTIAERLAFMPPATMEPDYGSQFNFAQDIAFDTSRIRNELGYTEVVPERDALRRTIASQPA